MMNAVNMEYEHTYSVLSQRKCISLVEKKGLLSLLRRYTFVHPEIESYINLVRSSDERKWNEAYTAARLAELWVVYKDLPLSRVRVPSLRSFLDAMEVVT